MFGGVVGKVSVGGVGQGVWEREEEQGVVTCLRTAKMLCQWCCTQQL